MELNLEMGLVALLVLVLNILDSVTTHIACNQYVDGELKCEGNPFMRKLMLRSGLLAEVVKHGGILALVGWFVVSGNLMSLRYAMVMLGLVVANNAFVVVSRAITKRKVVSPSKRLISLLHVPEKYGYAVVMAAICLLAMGIYELAWR